MAMNLCAKEKTSHLERILAAYCAPTIEGIKTANLVSIKKGYGFDFKNQLKEMAVLLKERGLYIYKLSECPKRALLLIYSKAALESKLQKEIYSDYLKDAGCNLENFNLDGVLFQLALRMREGESFPHEIGVFLDYPIEDIKGFTENCGENYKCCGYWKVYGDEERAKEIFCAYDALRDYYCECISKGEKINTIRHGGYSVG